MKIVTKEDVLDLFDNVFSEEALKTAQMVFMVESTDELVLALVKYINSQSRRAITSSLVVSSIEVVTGQLKEHLESLSESVRNN